MRRAAGARMATSRVWSSILASLLASLAAACGGSGEAIGQDEGASVGETSDSQDEAGIRRFVNMDQGVALLLTPSGEQQVVSMYFDGKLLEGSRAKSATSVTVKGCKVDLKTISDKVIELAPGAGCGSLTKAVRVTLDEGLSVGWTGSYRGFQVDIRESYYFEGKSGIKFEARDNGEGKLVDRARWVHAHVAEADSVMCGRTRITFNKFKNGTDTEVDVEYPEMVRMAAPGCPELQ